jgi:hypothetical protein
MDFSKLHTSITRSMSFNRRMAGPTNQYYQPLCTHNKRIQTHYSYLLFTEQDTLLLYPPSIPGRGPHHDSYSPSATNAQQCESPVGLYKFLPNLAYVRGIANEILYYSCACGLSGRRNAGSGLQLNHLQNHRLTSHASVWMVLDNSTCSEMRS